MLLFGFLGEIGTLPLKLSVSIGFVFFALTFKIVHKYGKQTEKGKTFPNILHCYGVYMV